MNQKKARRLNAGKLKDQAEIIYVASLGAETERDKLEFVVNAALRVKTIRCPERTKYFKEAIAIAEGLELPTFPLKLATIALKHDDEREFFLEVCRKYDKKEGE